MNTLTKIFLSSSSSILVCWLWRSFFSSCVILPCSGINIYLYITIETEFPINSLLWFSQFSLDLKPQRSLIGDRRVKNICSQYNWSTKSNKCLALIVVQGKGVGIRGEQGDGGVHKCMCMWYICVRICLMYLWHFQGQHKIQKKINIKHNNFSAGGFKVSWLRAASQCSMYVNSNWTKTGFSYD